MNQVYKERDLMKKSVLQKYKDPAIHRVFLLRILMVNLTTRQVETLIEVLEDLESKLKVLVVA
jgi:hypothetical protein